MIADNIFLYIGIIGVICLIYYIIRNISLKKLEPIIIKLITEAEKEFNSGEGSKKFDYVFQKLYDNFMPGVLKIFFTPKDIKSIIQFIFDKIKIALDYKGDWNG